MLSQKFLLSVTICIMLDSLVVDSTSNPFLDAKRKNNQIHKQQLLSYRQNHFGSKMMPTHNGQHYAPVNPKNVFNQPTQQYSPQQVQYQNSYIQQTRTAPIPPQQYPAQQVQYQNSYRQQTQVAPLPAQQYPAQQVQYQTPYTQQTQAAPIPVQQYPAQQQVQYQNVPQPIAAHEVTAYASYKQTAKSVDTTTPASLVYGPKTEEAVYGAIIAKPISEYKSINVEVTPHIPTLANVSEIATPILTEPEEKNIPNQYTKEKANLNVQQPTPQVIYPKPQPTQAIYPKPQPTQVVYPKQQPTQQYTYVKQQQQTIQAYPGPHTTYNPYLNAQQNQVNAYNQYAQTHPPIASYNPQVSTYNTYPQQTPANYNHRSPQQIYHQARMSQANGKGAMGGQKRGQGGHMRGQHRGQGGHMGGQQRGLGEHMGGQQRGQGGHMGGQQRGLGGHMGGQQRGLGGHMRGQHGGQGGHMGGQHRGQGGHMGGNNGISTLRAQKNKHEGTAAKLEQSKKMHRGNRHRKRRPKNNGRDKLQELQLSGDQQTEANAGSNEASVNLNANKPIVTASNKPIVTASNKPIVTASNKPIVTASNKPIVTASNKMTGNGQTNDVSNDRQNMRQSRRKGMRQGGRKSGRQGKKQSGKQGMRQGMKQGGRQGMMQSRQGMMQPGRQGMMQPGRQGMMQPGRQGMMQQGRQGMMQQGRQGMMQPGRQGMSQGMSGRRNHQRFGQLRERSNGQGNQQVDVNQLRTLSTKRQQLSNKVFGNNKQKEPEMNRVSKVVNSEVTDEDLEKVTENVDKVQSQNVEKNEQDEAEKKIETLETPEPKENEEEISVENSDNDDSDKEVESLNSDNEQENEDGRRNYQTEYDYGNEKETSTIEAVTQAPVRAGRYPSFKEFRMRNLQKHLGSNQANKMLNLRNSKPGLENVREHLNSEAEISDDEREALINDEYEYLAENVFKPAENY